MSWTTGVSAYPGAIDVRVPVGTGALAEPENATWTQDAAIKIQETLGINPQAGSGSVANRLDTGTFPVLNIAGASVLNDAMTINGDAVINGPLFPFTINRTAAAGAFNYMQFNREGTNDWRVEGEDPGQFLQFRSGTGAAVITMKLYRAGHVDIGQPTAQASPAQGDLNAERLFSQGTLVTCYVFEKAYGTFDQASWDALTFPDSEGKRSQHAPAKRFDASNDLDIEAYCATIKDRKALPNFPTKAEWAGMGKIELGDLCQRLIEAVETMGVHIASLAERVKALESA